MKRRPWHIDAGYDPSSFSNNWSADSHRLLLKLFNFVDQADGPVLSMLPPEISPAGAAVAASLYFLPGIRIAPEPHCHIALFPGFHFPRQIKEISFRSNDIKKICQQARILNRGGVQCEGPYEKLAKLSQDKLIYYHWIFKCQRVWTQYYELKASELTPRDYFGRNDNYNASMDFIETERFDAFNTNQLYDLFIYCPFYHPYADRKSDSDIELLLNKILKFPADRILIVARSPYDYWSRRLEPKLNVKGMAFASSLFDVHKLNQTTGIRFEIVNQMIELQEAYILFQAFKKASKNLNTDKSLLNHGKDIIRKLLVAVNPNLWEDKNLIEDKVWVLKGIAGALGIAPTDEAMKIIDKIMQHVHSDDHQTKMNRIIEISKDISLEVWVTNKLDQEAINDYNHINCTDIKVRFADKWMVSGAREMSHKILLARIDGEAEMNLVAYLRPGDMVLMSAWEAVVRGEIIMGLWERSEKWRENAEKYLHLASNAADLYGDPVLDLANFLDKINSKFKRIPDDIPFEITNEQSWWDENAEQSILNTIFERNQLIIKSGEKTFPCREILFSDGFGIFVKCDEEMQFVDDDGEILSVPVGNLQPNMMIFLFKDSERNSFFDILMDQLEHSTDYRNDALIVREWKTSLKKHVQTQNLKISEITEKLIKKGSAFDMVTVRSWIFGSTMAPRQGQHLSMLIDVLELKGINAQQIYQSVKKLRSISITLGKALNQLLLHGELDSIDEKIRAALVFAGIDTEELSEAVEKRMVVGVTETVVEIEGKFIGKMFKLPDT